MSLSMIILAVVLLGTSGIPALFMSKTSMLGQRIATLGISAGSIIGLNACRIALLTASPPLEAFFPWQAAGNSVIALDALSAFFLVPIFLVGALGSIYGLGYWPAEKHPRSARKLQFFWGTMLCGMTILVIARHAMAFLLGWEIMALSAFFLVSTEDEKVECRRAGFIYIIATHIGTLTLFAFFAYWRTVTGSFDLKAIPSGTVDSTSLGVLFLLALFGFGLKAGIMPLHFWLPGAHANAPSHVSAILSGVLLKMGVYGLLRICALLPEPPIVWGATVLLLGAVSGLFGVLFALGQHDLKRLLAYHSVENIGIIFMGLGLALLGRSTGRMEWIVLGTAGCLLHVWNHCFFKSLLFFGAGSVLHATGTRQIDVLGGLAKRMPWTAAFFLIGAAAICGLPPLNGFISELLIYLGLIGSLTVSAPPLAAAAAMIAPILATIGALAVACFVKAYGSVFLGTSRTAAAENVHEAPIQMLAAPAVLAVVCLLIGLFPGLVVPILDRVIAEGVSARVPSVGSLAPLGQISILSIILLAGILAFFTVALLATGKRRSAGTWDCGYARPTSRMQYTASSFAQSIIAMFAWALRPHGHRADVRGIFPEKTEMSDHVDDAVLDRVLLPAANGAERRADWFRRFQQGMTSDYILYVALALAILLCTLVPFKELAISLLTR
ncbi:MAG: proton-conducting transporter membrane subunit [Treponemataceae bacterium]